MFTQSTLTKRNQLCEFDVLKTNKTNQLKICDFSYRFFVIWINRNTNKRL